MELFNEYIGDGVYICYDGYHIILRTENHKQELCDMQIALEPSVLESLLLFYKMLPDKIKKWKENKDVDTKRED